MRSKTAPSKRKSWSHGTIEVKTQDGPAVPVTAPGQSLLSDPDPLRCLNLTGIVSGCYDDDFESSAAEDEHDELGESGEKGEGGEEGESWEEGEDEKMMAVSVQGHVCEGSENVEELTEDIQEWSGLYSHREEGSHSTSVSHVWLYSL